MFRDELYREKLNIENQLSFLRISKDDYMNKYNNSINQIVKLDFALDHIEKLIRIIDDINKTKQEG